METVKTYNRKINQVQAIQLSAGNAEEVVQWCGGALREETKPGDPTDIFIEVTVPNVVSNKKAHIGHFIVRQSDGRFYVRNAEEFLAEYEIPTRIRIEGDSMMHSNVTDPKAPLTPHYVARGNWPRG